MPPKKIDISPKSGIGPVIRLQFAGKLTPEQIGKLEPPARAVADLADSIRVRVTTRKEDATGQGGFGPFQNLGGMWGGMGVRVLGSGKIRVGFYGKSIQSRSWFRYAQTAENLSLREKKKRMVLERVVKPGKAQVSNQIKAAAAIGLIETGEKMARPEYRRELLEPSESEVMALLAQIESAVERAIVADAEYEAPLATRSTTSKGLKSGTLTVSTRRVTTKT